MLESLAKIGELFGEYRPYDRIEGDYVLVLNLKGDEDINKLPQEELKKLIELEEFTEEKLEKYFFKKSGTSNPPSWTPTLTLNRKSPEKSLKLSFGRLKELATLGGLNSINTNLSEETLEKLSEFVKEKLKDIPSKKRVILTLKIAGRYLGEIEEIRKGLQRFLEKRYRERLKPTNGVCAVCKEPKKVYGEGLFPVKFYTLDKPGFIQGGFKEEAFVFPICLECGRKLQEGWNFVVENLTFKFVGKIQFHLIPELVLEDEEKLKWLIEKRLLKSAETVEGLKEEAKRRLAQDERRIFKRISGEGNYFTVHLVFLQKEQQAERIKLYLYGIYPSRLKKLFEVKDYIDNLLSVDFNFSTVWEVFGSDLEREFYAYTYHAFRGIPFDENLLLGIALEKLNETLRDRESLKTFAETLKDTLSVYLFSVLSWGGLKMENAECLEKSETLEGLLNCFPLLEGETEKALFLLGALTWKLLQRQEIRLGNKPFLRKLKGLKMTRRDFENLYTELVNKLEEYDQIEDYPVLTREVKTLMEKVATLMLSAKDWELSTKRANFIFACGLGLGEKIFEVLSKEKEKARSAG